MDIAKATRNFGKSTGATRILSTAFLDNLEAAHKLNNVLHKWLTGRAKYLRRYTRAGERMKKRSR